MDVFGSKTSRFVIIFYIFYCAHVCAFPNDFANNCCDCTQNGSSSLNYYRENLPRKLSWRPESSIDSWPSSQCVTSMSNDVEDVDDNNNDANDKSKSESETNVSSQLSTLSDETQSSLSLLLHAHSSTVNRNNRIVATKSFYCDDVAIEHVESFLSQNNQNATTTNRDNRFNYSAIILKNVWQSNDDGTSRWYSRRERHSSQNVQRIFAIIQRNEFARVQWTQSRLTSESIALWLRQMSIDRIQLTNVTHLDLSENRLTTFAWHLFDVMPNIRVLTLANNIIETIAPDASFPMQQLIHLQRLDLSGNRLISIVYRRRKMATDTDKHMAIDAHNEIDVSVFEQMNELIDLDVSRNQIVDLPRSSFDGLQKLRFLHLANNQLSIIPFQVFQSIASVEYLDLSSNRLVTFLDNFFIVNKAIVALNLRNNSMEKVLKHSMFGMEKLLQLDLSENRLFSIDRNAFDGLTALQWLSLAKNIFASLPSSLFQHLSHLNFLNLSKNPFKSLWNGLLAGQTKLHELIIDETGLTKLGNLCAREADKVNKEIFVELRKICIRNNRQLHEIDAIFYRNLPSIEFMNLTGNALISMPHEVNEMSQLKILDLSLNHLIAIPRQIGHLEHLHQLSLVGNNFACDCQMAWIPKWIENRTISAGASSSSTATYSNDTPLNQLHRLKCRLGYPGDFLRVLQQLNCTKPSAVHVSSSKTYLLRSDAQLECSFTGNPVPDIIWVTPLNKIIRYYADPDVKALPIGDRTATSGHANVTSIYDVDQEHQAKNREKIEHQILKQNRLHFNDTSDVSGVTLLENGSLRIHNVSRRDSGLYTCYGYNIMGYVTAEIRWVFFSFACTCNSISS